MQCDRNRHNRKNAEQREQNHVSKESYFTWSGGVFRLQTSREETRGKISSSIPSSLLIGYELNLVSTVLS
jgi:hypothetical protein